MEYEYPPKKNESKTKTILTFEKDGEERTEKIARKDWADTWDGKAGYMEEIIQQIKRRTDRGFVLKSIEEKG